MDPGAMRQVLHSLGLDVMASRSRCADHSDPFVVAPRRDAICSSHDSLAFCSNEADLQFVFKRHHSVLGPFKIVNSDCLIKAFGRHAVGLGVLLEPACV